MPFFATMPTIMIMPISETTFSVEPVMNNANSTPLKASTLVLWAGPFVFLAGGFYLLIRFLRRRRVPPPQLTSAQRERAAKLLE